MALRVLLADNSETIKKVIQLSLQDFAAEVRVVSVGLDALSVAKSFKPDIIFADILLQKRSGYEVCLDIKQDSELRGTPVVLMWSGFMELDQSKAQSSLADATLEKPFDSDMLRNLVKKLVPKTQTQTFSELLEVPSFAKTDMPTSAPTSPASAIPASAVSAPTLAAPPPLAPTPPPITNTPKSDWSMDSFEDIGEFAIQEPAAIPPTAQPPPLEPIHADPQEDFAQVSVQDFSKNIEPAESLKPNNPLKSKSAPTSSEFELDVPDENDFDGVTVNYTVPTDEINDMSFLMNFQEPPPVKSSTATKNTTASAVVPPTKAAAQAAPNGPAQNPTPTINAPTQLPSTTPAIAKPSTPATVAEQTKITLTETELHDLVRDQAREIIEKIAWKLLPDMAENIIRNEIKRLLDDSPHG